MTTDTGATSGRERVILPLENLVEGILLRRYKRFLADVQLPDGSVVTAHCPNTGPMSGVLHPGGTVRLRHDPRPGRKLAWTWEQALTPGANGHPCWVGVNTAPKSPMGQTGAAASTSCSPPQGRPAIPARSMWKSRTPPGARGSWPSSPTR
jgi:sugar fermentation stimulation protein A